jgi:transcriptional regulator with GAF, ATPase, and Fis domain
VTSSVNEDSTLREPREVEPAAEVPDASLWVIACPETSRIGQRLPIRRDEALLLGRKIDRGGAAFDDERMSRVHARVSWDRRCSGYRVADMGSANGTFVNGKRANEATLENGSVLRAGETLVVFVEQDALSQFEWRLEQAARSAATVVLLGESGTGKELAARRIHALSDRQGACVTVNCAAVPRDLFPAELFGHSRGAFSGADKERAGLFRAAEAGTLFLDEIGDLPLELQPALLRVLEYRTVRPIGSEREAPVDVRVVAATNQDLRAEVERGAFRLDLYARIAQVEIRVPALRERRHTLPALLAALSASHEIGDLRVAPDAMEAVALYGFEKNVRELKNLLGRLKIFGSSPFKLDLAFLEREAPEVIASLRERQKDPPALKSMPSRAVTREELLAALARNDQRVAGAAEELRTSRTQVYRWLKRFGIEGPSRRR